MIRRSQAPSGILVLNAVGQGAHLCSLVASALWDAPSNFIQNAPVLLDVACHAPVRPCATGLVKIGTDTSEHLKAGPVGAIFRASPNPSAVRVLSVRARRASVCSGTSCGDLIDDGVLLRSALRYATIQK